MVILVVRAINAFRDQLSQNLQQKSEALPHSSEKPIEVSFLHLVATSRMKYNDAPLNKRDFVNMLSHTITNTSLTPPDVSWGPYNTHYALGGSISEYANLAEQQQASLNQMASQASNFGYGLGVALRNLSTVIGNFTANITGQSRHRKSIDKEAPKPSTALIQQLFSVSNNAAPKLPARQEMTASVATGTNADDRCIIGNTTQHETQDDLGVCPAELTASLPDVFYGPEPRTDAPANAAAAPRVQRGLFSERALTIKPSQHLIVMPVGDCKEYENPGRSPRSKA